MPNPFDLRSASLSGPALDYQPVTPSNTVALPSAAIGLYVEGAGAVSFVSQAGTTRTVNVPAFGWVLCGVRQVRATGTTASGIHALLIS